jgi:hypothetical protein
MLNYTKKLPRDETGESMQDFAQPFKAKAQYSKENASISSVISLSHDTTSIEVTTGGTPAVIRWVATGDTAASVISAATGANFDNAIPVAWTRRFVVPIESVGLNNVGSAVGINRMAGLYQRVAIKSTGIGSVLLAEF